MRQIRIFAFAGLGTESVIRIVPWPEPA